MEILTRAEGEQLNAARRLLCDIEHRLQQETTNEAWQLRSLGKIQYAFNAAEGAVFDALNMLSSHGEDKIADEYTVYVGRSVEDEEAANSVEV